MLAPSPLEQKAGAANAGGTSIGLVALSFVLAALIFVVEVFVPLGVAGAVPYAAVVLIGLWSRWRPHILVFAGLGTVLTVLSHFYSHGDGDLWVIIADHGLAILIICATAIFAVERQRGEARLRAEVARTRSILTTLIDGVVTIDLRGAVTSLNPAAVAMFGYAPEEVIGNNVKILMTEADKSRHDGYLQQYLQTGKASIIGFGREVVGRRKDGSTFALDLGISESIIGGEAGYTGILREITERKRTEDALRHSESQLRLLADSLPVVVMSLDTDLRFRFANKAYREIHNYTQADILGLDFREVIGETGYQILKPNLDAVLEGRSVEFETTYTFVDGIERNVVASYVPEIDERGAVRGIYVMLIDVTERNLAAEELKQSEAQMRLVTDALPVLIAYIDANRRFRFVNETAETWFAKQRADIIGKSIVEVVGEAQAKRSEPMLERVELGETIEQEFAETYPDGVTRIVKMNIVPDFGAGGEVRGHFALFQDITQRKRAEEALRRSDSQLRLLADNLPVMIYSLDTQLRFRFANEAYCEAHNRTQEEIIGKDLRDVHGMSAYHTFKSNIATALKGRSTQFEVRFKFGDGVERDIEASYVPELDDQGAVRGLYVMLVDVTERKRSEKVNTRLGRIVDHATNEIYVFDAETLKFTNVNQGAQQNLGYSLAELNELTPVDIKPEFTAEAFGKMIEPLRNGEQKALTFETVHQRKDGTTYDVEVRLQLAQAETPPVFFAIIVDISERRLSEEALRRSEASLANAQRIAHIGSWEWEIVAGNLHWSDEIYNIFGLEPQAFGATYEAFLATIHPDDRTMVEEAVNAALDGRTPYSIDHRIVLPSGEVRIVHEQAEIERDADGKPVSMLGTVQDITERRRAESALKESEETLNAFFSNAPVGMALYDRDLRYLKVNEQLAWDPDLSVSEHVGKTIAEVKPDFAKYVEPVYRDILESGDIKMLPEYRGEMPSDPGVEHWWWGFAFPTSWENGKPSKIGVVALDITERKRTEEALRESEELLRAVMDNSPAVISIRDVEGHYQLVNRAYERLFGVANEEIRGRSPDEILPPDFAADLINYDRMVIESGKPLLHEHKAALGSGDDTLLSARFPIRDASGNLVSVGSIATDITERKRAEAALKESEARLDAFFTNAPVGLAMFGERQKYLKINEVMAEWNGVPSEDHIGKTLPEIFPAYEKSGMASFQHIMETGESVLNQELSAAPAGRPVSEMTWLVSRFPIPGASGNPAGVGSIVIDITEQKRAREEIRKLNAELEHRVEKRTIELRTAQAELVRKERLATLGQLSATVSHELRNPLGTIRNSLVVLENKLGRDHPDINRSVDRMVRNIGRCNNIVDEMLDFARTRELELKNTAFDDWLGGILDEFRVPPGITVTRKLGAPKVRLGIDDDRMRRAIVNVYDNACQAMTEETEGKGKQKKKVLTVSTKATKARLELTIADTGPGMPPEVFAAAFEPLYSTKGFGVGLGLPIVKQIMEQHGGNIEITNKHGSGTQVVLSLPLGQITKKPRKGAKR